LERTEENGSISGADATKISNRAVNRGYKQIGTLGSGNHYLEIQVAKPEYIFDTDLAKAFGVDIPKQVVVMFHCGSRGFGHQVATDYPVYSRRKRERINGGIRGKILWRHGFPFHWSQDHWAAAKQP
jgi:RNA-splicing ligase RtcB